MLNYDICDKTVKYSQTDSFGVATKALIDFFDDVDFDVLDESIEDYGNRGRDISKIDFILANAYNLALAAKENRAILCAGDGLYNSLSYSQNFIFSDEVTTARVNKKLELVKLELKSPVKIKHIVEVIYDDIGLQKLSSSIKYPFNNFNVACYYGNDECGNFKNIQEKMVEILKCVGANIVKIDSSNKPNGFGILDFDEDMAYKKASTIILEAYDKNADMLVTNSASAFFMIDQNVKKCELASGRDIKIPLLNISQIVSLAVGITNEIELGLTSHNIKPEFL